LKELLAAFSEVEGRDRNNSALDTGLVLPHFNLAARLEHIWPEGVLRERRFKLRVIVFLELLLNILAPGN